MDAKEILRLMIRHRFWIVLGIAALLPIIGYFVTAGAVKEETEAKTGEIKTAKSGAESYSSGTVPNGQYGTFTQTKIAAIEEDVETAHGRLYDLQASLLDWPAEVAPQISAWGRDIPKDVSSNETQDVAYIYTQVYDDYAKNVYETVDPWDSIEGEGIVVTPPMESLLATVSFDPASPPSISKVWQYQENLWVRRSILEVIAQVNQKAGATDWESASIKQINRLEVGNPNAVDHRTAAEGYELKDPPEVTKGGESLEPAAPTSGAGGAAGMPGMGGMADMMGQMGGGMDSSSYGAMMGGGSMMGSGGMMGGPGGGGGGPVRFLQPEGVELFRDYPAHVSVLIDQNAIQNFLVEFENSPMSMRVLEVNWTRPTTRVQPPVKGQGFSGYGMMGGFGMGSGGGLYGMEMGMPGMMGGMPGDYGAMMGMPGMMGGGRGDMMGMPGMMGGGGGMSSLNQPRQKVRRDLTPEEEKEAEGEPEKVTIFDPYYNVVELQVYVQARFFYPPAAEEPTEDVSQGDPTLAESPDGEAMTDESLPATDAEATIPEADAEAPEFPSQDDPAEPGIEPIDPVADDQPVPSPTEDDPAEPDSEPEPESPAVVEPEPAEPGIERS